jgi:GT2 family glycosyltransferase/glycosyltransferase involved in cell wall biosynthesis
MRQDCSQSDQEVRYDFRSPTRLDRWDWEYSVSYFWQAMNSLSLRLRTPHPFRAIFVFFERLYTWCIAAIWRVQPRLIFDQQYYLSTHDEIARSGMDPLFHFLKYGAALGYKPHPLFDPRYYLDRYPDVARAGYNPLLHFLRFGALEGRQPHPDFDGAFYLVAYPDVAAKRMNPLIHFLIHGAEEGRLPHSDFNASFYLLAHPDVAAANMDPVLHFAKHGASEGRLSRRATVANAPVEFFLPSRALLRAAPNREIDVVIPVYKGLRETQACIESVLSSPCSSRFRAIVINDASPESELTWFIRRLADKDKITLIENPRNLGFVRSANAGMQTSKRDVVLLNSDTVVSAGWLDRLAACVYADERTGTVTPFSNNATICSYPVFCAENQLSVSSELAKLDAAFATVNSGRAVDIPTAVGFCMYIRRDCLEDTGLFDAEAFGLGYGEENDFCMRAAAKGWKHKLACDVFVYHSGGVSFGEASARQRRAMEILIGKHPGYPDLIQRHIHADPAKAYRIAVTAHRIRTSGKRVFLSVVHSLGGGVAQHLSELVASTANEVMWLNLKPAPSGTSMLECLQSGYQFSLALNSRSEYDHLVAVVKACGIERIHIHHLMGHTADLQHLAQDLSVPLDFTIHDYYTICPQVTLTDEHGRYCGEPDGDGCERCLAKRPASGGGLDIFSWRARHAWVFARASRVIAPSADTGDRMQSYFPQAHIVAAEHQSASLQRTVTPRPLLPNERLRVAVLGTMTVHKGFELLQQCAESARRSALPIEFILVGNLETGLPKLTAVRETGSYKFPDLPAVIKLVSPHLVWFPTRGPETFSYTLSTCLELGFPILAPDIGAFPERLEGRPWTWIVPWDWSEGEWLDLLLRIRRDNFLPGTGPCLPSPRSRALPAFYPAQYLKEDKPPEGPRARRLPKRITITAAVASDEGGQIQACGYVRIIQPLSHPAVSDGIRLAVTTPMDLVTAEADIVLIQRSTVRDMNLAERIIQTCRRRGSRLVYEIDDDLFNIPTQHPEQLAYIQVLQAAKFLARSADAIVTSTNFLRQQMLAFNSNTVVIPNYLDDRLWIPPLMSTTLNAEQVRVLYAGTVSHRDDLKFLGEAVRKLKLGCRGKLRIEVIGISQGAEQPDWFEAMPVPPLIAASYPRFVSWIQNENRWHWGVAPLLDTQFNRSKSGLKFLEYSALGLPSICSDMPGYRDVVHSEQTGILSTNDIDSWVHSLERAVTDAQLWARLHKNCQSIVDQNTISSNAETIKLVWTALAGGNPIKPLVSEACR